MYKKPVVVIAALILAGVCALFAAVLMLNQETHTILLTEAGFEPSYLEVEVGATVIFKTTRKAPFWPASNVHPTHTAYSDFDPKKPIAADMQWAYTFTEAGTYGFHDHIDPFATGTISVAVDGESQVYGKDCAEKEQSCYDEKLRAMTRNEGVKAAFSQFEKWYTQDASFSEGCHGYTHSIGQEAYAAYAETGNVEVTSLAGYCGFGFYHGFMESMLHQTGDLEAAKDFCADFDKKLSVESPGASIACLHGIGHGVIDGSDPTQWGSASKMIRSGLTLCERVGETYYEKKICSTGVFNALANLYFDPTYRLVVDTQEPYKICNEQEQDYFKEACYEDMNTLVWKISGFDFNTAITYIETIQNDPFAYTALRSLATVAGSAASADSFSADAATCQRLSLPLQNWCIDGLAAGLIETGAASSTFHLAFDFCDTPSLDSNNKDACYRRTIGLLERIASPETYALACSEAKVRYQGICPQ